MPIGLTARNHKFSAANTAISDYDGRRDNNLTFLRIVFASVVLFGHGFAITNTHPDPISQFLNLWIGDVAVNGFFLVSGFLITGSFKRQGLFRFALLRLMRIYPAIIVCIALSIVAGSLVTDVTSDEYWSSPMTWAYAQNIYLQYLSWDLPGVFAGHPTTSVNGSLWTLPVELRCYFLLMCIGFFGVLDSRMRANFAGAFLLLIVYVDYSYIPLMYHEAFGRPLSYFIVGVLVWANRDLIKLSPIGATSAVALCSFGALVENQVLFCIGFSYTVFYIAFAVRHLDFDKFGDISYGIYIYAWPVQQLVWNSEQDGFSNFLIAAPITVLMATGSWFLVEKPCLNFLRKPKTAHPLLQVEPSR